MTTSEFVTANAGKRLFCDAGFTPRFVRIVGYHAGSDNVIVQPDVQGDLCTPFYPGSYPGPTHIWKWVVPVATVPFYVRVPLASLLHREPDAKDQRIATLEEALPEMSK